jgi:hypothetical protein
MCWPTQPEAPVIRIRGGDVGELASGWDAGSALATA